MLLFLCACAGDGGVVPPAAPPAASPVAVPTGAPAVTPAAPENISPQPAQQPADSGTPVTPVPATGEVVISFEFTRQSGSASNQYAVWIEDTDGRLVRTLYASRWTANGGYRTRPDSIALWAERSDLANMSRSDVDAVSGATPRGVTQTYYTWDLTDANGAAVLTGEYVVFVEGTLRWKNYVLYSAAIEIGDVPVTVQADAQFHYEASDRYAALTTSSTENDMIGPVTVSFAP